MADKVFGIDLGTTYSCVSYINDSGKEQVILNDRGQRTTPSAVWFDGKRVVVGEEAKEMAKVYPQDVCQFIKRSMGDSSFYAEYAGEPRTPEEISSLILRKLAKDASEAVGEKVTDVVITCPAYFFVKERDATKRAGELAGLNVLEILNEPTAAAISYGMNGHDKPKTILVYDLGGGTFDVTTIKFDKDGDRVLFTDGDHHLGGKDWDDRLVRLIAERFQDETGVGDDILDNSEAVAELFLLAENVKKQLSDKTKVSVRFTYDDETARFDVTRQEFEEVTSDLLARTINFTRDIVQQTRADGSFIDEILLVGGSTKMPIVPKAIEEAFLIKPQLFDPDEAVAKGAAIYGNNLRLKRIIEERLNLNKSKNSAAVVAEVAAENGYTLDAVAKALKPFSNVTSRSFGIAMLREGQSSEGCAFVYNAIYRNTSLPTEGFIVGGTTCDNQDGVWIQVYSNSATRDTADEGFVPISECEPLWEGMLNLPTPDLPAGSEIYNYFSLSSDGFLSVITMEPQSQAHVFARINTTTCVSPDEQREQERRCAELNVD